MQCPNCGKVLDENEKICTNCGLNLEKINVFSHDNNTQPPVPNMPSDGPYPNNSNVGQNDFPSNPQQYNNSYQAPYSNPGQYQNPYQDNLKPQYTELDSPLPIKSFVGMLLINIIPCIGLIFLFIWSFSSNTNTNKRNLARAMLIIWGCLYALSGIITSIVVPFLK
ncbi:MAG: zinc ribbon domain-containing protein [Clostridiales bacterium]|jgi:hypothetical protein|nr:zinc ribbon domain-containing protein [Clostridiales bacterium]